MCVFVCVCVCAHIHNYVCVYVCMYVCQIPFLGCLTYLTRGGQIQLDVVANFDLLRNSSRAILFFLLPLFSEFQLLGGYNPQKGKQQFSSSS